MFKLVFRTYLRYNDPQVGNWLDVHDIWGHFNDSVSIFDGGNEGNHGFGEGKSL
jgi:hypothetical protein